MVHMLKGKLGLAWTYNRVKLPPLFVEHCAFGPSVAALATPTNHINTGYQAILQESRCEII